MIVKGIVHSKIKIVIICSTSCYSKPVWFPFFCETKDDILKNAGNQTFWWPLIYIVVRERVKYNDSWITLIENTHSSKYLLLWMT